jgi:hypothetical protein
MPLLTALAKLPCALVRKDAVVLVVAAGEAVARRAGKRALLV